jgi:hypothetical protein
MALPNGKDRGVYCLWAVEAHQDVSGSCKLGESGMIRAAWPSELHALSSNEVAAPFAIVIATSNYSHVPAVAVRDCSAQAERSQSMIEYSPGGTNSIHFKRHSDRDMKTLNETNA